MEKATWTVIGGILDSGWGKDFDMTEVETGVWKSEALALKAGEEFKCRANADWAINYGLTDGAAVQDGGNVKVEADGTYVITLDINALTITLGAE